MSEAPENSRAKVAIDALLEGKSDTFSAIVLRMARQMGWDDDDPAFLIVLAAEHLKDLVVRLPDRITEAIDEASGELAGDWQQLQAKLTVSAMNSANTAHQISTRLIETQVLVDTELSKVEGLLSAEREGMLQAMQDERAAVSLLLKQEQQAISQQAQAVAEHQKQVLEAHTKDLIAQAVVANQARADTQVKQIVKGVRGKHYWEAMAYACVAAAFIFSLAWSSGWLMSSRAQAASTWGDIARWNQDELAACIEVAQPTCNFHIEVPK